MTKAKRQENEELQTLATMLMLALDKVVTLGAMRKWTPEQRAEAEKWAGLSYLRASDNNVKVPPKPSFLL